MFIFYDTETTGLNRDFDQILQIALVFTDENLNVLSSKKLECRRSPWSIPSPGAMLITGFTPDDLKSAKISHAQMMAEVVGWTKGRHWPVIFAGYNTLGFDEGIFAANLEQTLHDQGLTTATNPYNNKLNGRFDVFSVVKAAYAYMPGALKLDEKNEYGSVKLSLMSVAEQNGVVLSAHDAHDAMNDIRATLDLAKVIRKVAPDLWDQMTRMSTRAGVDKFIAAHPVFTHSIVTVGKVNAGVVCPVADGVFFDLTQDPTKVMAMSEDELVNVFTQKGPRPFRTYNAAEQPILMPLDQSDAVLPKDFNEALAQSRAQLIASDPAFMARVAKAREMVAAQAVKPAPVQPELSGGVAIDPAVQLKLNQWKKDFLEAPDWKSAAAIVDRFYSDLGCAEGAKPELRRFANFAGRLVYEHAPECLSADKLKKMREYIAKRVLATDTNVAWPTIPKARKELEQIEQERQSGSSKWKHVQDKDIRALKLYYTALEKEYAPYLPASKPASNDNPPDAGQDKKHGGGFRP